MGFKRKGQRIEVSRGGRLQRGLSRRRARFWISARLASGLRAACS